jgi:hypothetical protein
VAHPGEEPLQQHALVAEHALGEALDLLELDPQRAGVGGDSHAHTATAGRGLDHDRVADLLGSGQRRVDVADRLAGTG